MTNIHLFRKRIIPEECVFLKDDEIIDYDEEKQILMTKWHALKPKKNLHHGYSCYFLDKGIKVSKFYKEDNSLLYWYCDIIDAAFTEEFPKNYTQFSNDLSKVDESMTCLIATDLLADVIIYPDGFVKVVDVDELSSAFEAHALSLEMLLTALKRLSNLLEYVYSGKFEELKTYIESKER